MNYPFARPLAVLGVGGAASAEEVMSNEEALR